MSFSKVDMLINSLIGEGTVLRGEFDINGVLRIDGIFYGSINGKGKVLIGEGGEAHSDINAKIVVIGGTVYGNVIATERITILSTGKLIGNIQTPRLVIEEGTIFDGKCNVLRNNKKEKVISDKEQIKEDAKEIKTKKIDKQLVENK